MSLPARIYGPDQVDIAYEPCRLVEDVAMRVGPSEDAPIVLARGIEVILREGRHLGRQSTRNPDCRDKPPLRPAVDGWVWGYGIRPNTQKSGWVPLAALDRDGDFRRRACGPAGSDFDRRFPNSCRGHCDGRPLQGVQRLAGPARVIAREVYLRYSPRGTAFRYLVRGDTVRLLCRWRFDRHDYTGVEVVEGEWTPSGIRGWVISNSVRRSSGRS